MELQPPWLGPVLGSAAVVVFSSTFASTYRLFRALAAAEDARLDLPQAILVLGGDRDREHLAAKFAAGAAPKVYSSSKHAANVKLLPVYVSSPHDDAGRVMRRVGVHPSRLHIDNRALDTVTNFTTMVSSFKAANYSHVYMVTSDYHMSRAAMLANIILRTNGITFTSVSLPSEQEDAAKSETRIRRERDRVRAILWLIFGWHGADFLRFTKPNRYREHKKKDIVPKNTND